MAKTNTDTCLNTEPTELIVDTDDNLRGEDIYYIAPDMSISNSVSLFGRVKTFIEINFDKKVLDVKVYNDTTKIYLSYPLDDSQKEKLLDNFTMLDYFFEADEYIEFKVEI